MHTATGLTGLVLQSVVPLPDSPDSFYYRFSLAILLPDSLDSFYYRLSRLQALAILLPDSLDSFYYRFSDDFGVRSYRTFPGVTGLTSWRGAMSILPCGVQGTLAFIDAMLRAFLTGLPRAPAFGVGDWLSAVLFRASGASPEVPGRYARRVSLCAVVGQL